MLDPIKCAQKLACLTGARRIVTGGELSVKLLIITTRTAHMAAPRGRIQHFSSNTISYYIDRV